MESLKGALLKLPSNVHVVGDLLESAFKCPDLTDKTCAIDAETGQTLTFGELRAKSRLVANYLMDYQKVGISMNPSFEYLVTLCGVIERGVLFVPIDPNLPNHRIEYIAKDSQVDIILFSPKWKDQVDCEVKRVSYDEVINGSALSEYISTDDEKNGEKDFCVMYTSGSTGAPKGVKIPHRAVINRLYWEWETFPFEASYVCCAKTSIGFVDSIAEIWAPLLKGIPVVIIPKHYLLSPSTLVSTLNEHKANSLTLVPSLLRVVLDYMEIENRTLPHLKRVICSGETLTMSLGEKFFKQFPGNCLLLNYYGSTEIMADGTFQVFTRSDDLVKYSYEKRLSIGTPISNADLYLHEPDDRGVGKIIFSGLNVANGYFNVDPTSPLAQKFVEPLSLGVEESKSRLMFRTGDKGKIHNGFIVYFGRNDSQVKINGNRVDLSEIDIILRNHCNCVSPVVVLEEGKVLAFLSEDEVPENVDRKSLETYLPPYAIPMVVRVPKIPLLASSGKVDRIKLVHIYNEQKDIKLDFDVNLINALGLDPETKLKLITLSQVLTEVDIKVSVTEDFLGKNFFSCGGTSLNAILVMEKLKRKGFEISVNSFLEAKDFAAIIRSMNDNVEYYSSDCCFIENNAVELTSDLKKGETLDLLVDAFLEKETLVTTLHRRDPAMIAEMREDFGKILAVFWPYFSFNSLSFGLVDRSTRRLVAAAMNFDGDNEPTDMPESRQLGDIIGFLVSCETPVIESLRDKGVTKILHGFMMAVALEVAPSEKVGLMLQMEKEVIRMAQRQGYQAIVVTNTSEITIQMAEYCLGYETVKSVKLLDYEDEKGAQIFKEAEPHQAVAVCVKHL